MKGECMRAVRHQIQMEIDASYAYLAMGAYFSRDTVNRPGFAELFFKSAKEEREHGSKLIEYLSMRGQLTKDVTSLIKTPVSRTQHLQKLAVFLYCSFIRQIVNKHDWENGSAALEDALNLETKVTKSIRKLIETCEKGYNHYHLVDYLTGVYLEEQLHGQRELAGKLSTLKKMMTNHGALGEFLFDKDL